MSNSAAILTIGSLFWSNKDHRKAWRQKRLIVGAATRVRAPIRYGRVSSGKTYTMVFSNGLLPEQFGWALAVRCRGVVHTFAQLIEEAEALWAAEQTKLSNPGPLAASWGAVGLLANPNRTGRDSLMAGWSARVAAEHHIYTQFPHGHGEVAAVTPGGLLAIPWPVTESGDSLDVDFVLATATAPTSPQRNIRNATGDCSCLAKRSGTTKLFRRNSTCRDSDSIRRRHSAMLGIDRLTSKWSRRAQCWRDRYAEGARLI